MPYRAGKGKYKTMNYTKEELLKPFSRKFLPPDFTVTGVDAIKPWVDNLLERPLHSAGELQDWLEDYSELEAVLGEDYNLRYVAMTCDTKSKAKTNAYLQFVREIQPKLSEWSDALNKKFYGSPYHVRLDGGRYGRLTLMIGVSIELFIEKNIPLDTKLSEMSQQYQSITGAWSVEFDGEKRTMPQMGRYLLKTDRTVRESAWRATTARRLQDTEKLDALFDEMVKTRHEYAQNLGLPDYRAYAFKSKLRDYTPDDCLRFHDAIEKAAVPVVRHIMEKRKAEMKLDSLRPWDTAVDPLGRPPLEPFKEVSRLQKGTGEIFNKVDRRLGAMFSVIGETMDLDSRDGKAPGGYQTTFEERRIPFIFTNAAGLHGDVTTLLHEGGHAFHTLQCRRDPLIWYRHAAMEFSEVASMTQELLGNEHVTVFYDDPAAAKRAMYEQLERTVDIFPWVATVDAFQHWIYTNPQHNREERAAKWLEISTRFEAGVDWSGLDINIRKFAWHRQLHIFEVPFYYIEYAIAQLGALQIYRNYKNDSKKAVDAYLSALALGGSKGPKELFAAAGVKFDFSLDMLGQLMKMVEGEMAALK